MKESMVVAVLVFLKNKASIIIILAFKFKQIYKPDSVLN